MDARDQKAKTVVVRTGVAQKRRRAALAVARHDHLHRSRAQTRHESSTQNRSKAGLLLTGTSSPNAMGSRHVILVCLVTIVTLGHGSPATVT